MKSLLVKCGLTTRYRLSNQNEVLLTSNVTIGYMNLGDILAAWILGVHDGSVNMASGWVGLSITASHRELA